MFWLYLKTHRKGIAAAAFFCAVTVIVFTMYRLPLPAIAYAAAICAFFGAVFLAAGCARFCLKHLELQKRLEELEASAAGEGGFSFHLLFGRLPQPEGVLEEDLQAIIEALCREERRMQEESQRRFQEMSDYYTVWAHQVKTPIAAMRLMLQEETQPLDGQRREILEELQRIEQYVEMVLCYLRLDSDSTDYVFREYDLDEIVRQAVRRHAPTFIRRKLRLEYEPFHVRVVTDEKWLLFVIEQVLSNALKYTREGSIGLVLEPPKTLCIRDTGIGIAPEDLPRIFEKGYTGDNGRGDKKASGIGMYLCSRICENLGHRISVSSVPGQGTEVRIDLKNAELEVE